jgi:hypothetical protein
MHYKKKGFLSRFNKTGWSHFGLIWSRFNKKNAQIGAILLKTPSNKNGSN